MPTLFALETAQVQLTWSLKRRKPGPATPRGGEPLYGLSVQTLQAGVEPHVQEVADAPGYLFEETTYQLFLQSRTPAPATLRHPDPVLLQGVQRSDAGRVLHGPLNFGSQVGRSRFVIEIDGRPHLAFTVEVFPSKLDYRRDYEALQAEVRSLHQELVLDYLRATYRPGRQQPQGRPGKLAWVYLLGDLVDDLEQAFTYLARHTLWETTRAVDLVRADRIRRPDTTLLRSLQRDTPRPRSHTVGGIPVPEHLPSMHGRYTLDTPAHRWLAAQLRRTQEQLRQLQAEEAALSHSPRRKRLLDALDRLQRRLLRLSRHAFMEAAEGPAPEAPPFRLLTTPGYRAAYRAFLLLQQSLHLEGGPLHLGLKDLHLLYEYWCFLTVVRLVAACLRHERPFHTLITVEQHGLKLRLRKGRTQQVAFGDDRGRRVTVTYNPRFGGTAYLVPQQPDILLAVDHREVPPARYVLDAKYRLDSSPAYQRRYGMPGPPAEALNTLHRYRDAIQTPVAQALALFPYREDREGLFSNSRHRRMLDTIGVGAIPLLPGATHHLEAWLQTVVNG